jgi:plastocyanin domain-containing protein
MQKQSSRSHAWPRRVIAVLALAAVAASCSKPSDARPEGAAPAQNGLAIEGRRVDITAGAQGYSPAVIEAKTGESLVLRFTRTAKGNCLAQVVFPELKITRDLPLDTPVEIGIKADKPGRISFECGMAMVHGSVNVSGG